MQIGVANDPERELKGEIRWIAENGFDYVDLNLAAPAVVLESTPWKEVAQIIQDHDLGVICHAPAYLSIDSPSTAIRQAALGELRRTIDAAQILGANLCTTRFLGWPAHLSEARGYDFYRQLYSILLTHGQERNVKIALENRADNSHQLKYFREIFHRLPDLHLHYNVAHSNIGTAQSMTRDFLFALAERLIHVSIGDNGGTDDDQLPFGAPTSGGIELDRELRLLRRFHYDGSITLEIGGDRRWLLACADMLRESWQRE